MASAAYLHSIVKTFIVSAQRVLNLTVIPLYLTPRLLNCCWLVDIDEIIHIALKEIILRVSRSHDQSGQLTSLSQKMMELWKLLISTNIVPFAVVHATQSLWNNKFSTSIESFSNCKTQFIMSRNCSPFTVAGSRHHFQKHWGQ